MGFEASRAALRFGYDSTRGWLAEHGAPLLRRLQPQPVAVRSTSGGAAPLPLTEEGYAPLGLPWPTPPTCRARRSPSEFPIGGPRLASSPRVASANGPWRRRRAPVRTLRPRTPPTTPPNVRTVDTAVATLSST